MTIPPITIEQLEVAFPSAEITAKTVAAVNERIDKANAEQSAQPEQYITAHEAAKYGRVEMRKNPSEPWEKIYPGSVLPFNYQYRAIKAQPEPADPHADLRAEYAKQVMNGTAEFYKWECKFDGYYDWSEVNVGAGFGSNKECRCTNISCYVSKDGEPAIRMLRAEAQKLQARLGDTVEWSLSGITFQWEGEVFTFEADKPYTYRTKATIKLNGRMVTPEQAAAEWEAKKKTHQLWFSFYSLGEWEDVIGHPENMVKYFEDSSFTFELRPKALKI